MTGSTWLLLDVNSILALQDLTSALADPLADEKAQLAADVYGGDGVLGSTKAAITYASSLLTLSATVEGYTESGERLTLDHTADEWQDIPFADSGATTYHVGARANRRPIAVSSNTIDNQPTYTREIEDVGELGPPNAAADLGPGVDLIVDTLVAPGWTVGGGTRPAYVWLVTPATSGGDAIYTGNVVYSGGAWRVQVPHNMGQATVSTNAADYRVFIPGPTVRTTDLSLDPAYLYLGTVVSGLFNDMNQPLFGYWSDLVTAFEVEHRSSDGSHRNVLADSVQAGQLGTPSGTKVQTQAGSGGDSAGFAQVAVANETPTNLVELWADGAYGGRLRFPRADLGSTGGALIDVRDNSSTGAPATVDLWISDLRDQQHNAEIIYDGALRWNPAKVPAAGGTGVWEITGHSSADLTLVVDNTDSGKAHLRLDDGNLTSFQGKATIGSTGLELYGSSSVVTYLTARARTAHVAAYMGQTRVAGSAADIRHTSTPPHVRSSTTSVWTAVYPLNHLWLDAAAEGLTIAELECTYYRSSATGSITVRLMRAEADGTAAPVQIGTWSATSTSGTWVSLGIDVTGIGAILDTDRHYWLELTIDPNGDSAANYRVHSIRLKFDRTKVD